MKMKLHILRVGAVVIATCAIGPRLISSNISSALADVLTNPLSVLEQRSPGVRGEGATVDTKRRPDRLALNRDSAGAPGAGSEGPQLLAAGGPLPGIDAAGPLLLGGDPLFGASGAGAGGPDVGSVSGPGYAEPYIPGIPNTGGGGGGGGPIIDPGSGSGGGNGSGGDDGSGGSGGGSGGGGSGVSDGGGGGGPVPVPEADTWAMLILGFACSGVAMRKSLRSAAKICG